MRLTKNRLALVSGAGGFIGSHLCELLVERGYKVRALCHYNSLGHHGWLEGSPFKREMEIVVGDIRDEPYLRDVVSGVDVIFHLAALIAIPFSYRSPHSYSEVNTKGSLNLLEAARREGVSRFVQTSTSEVYGSALWVPINETHPLQAQSPYSASKIGADAVAYSYFASYGLPVVIARPFNTYGPRQSARAVIPSIISQLLSGKTTIKLGNVSPTRDFNFVVDTCNGLLSLSECDGAIGKSVNIGSGLEISVGDLAIFIANLLNIDLKIEADEQRLRPVHSEVNRLICDHSLLSELTGFTPVYDLKTGLIETIKWFQTPLNLSKYKPNDYGI